MKRVDTGRGNTAMTCVQPANLTEGLVKPAKECAIVIFGAAGDLTRRLLIPALYNLARSFSIVRCVAHAPMSSDDFRTKMSGYSRVCNGSSRHAAMAMASSDFTI